MRTRVQQRAADAVGEAAATRRGQWSPKEKTSGRALPMGETGPAMVMMSWQRTLGRRVGWPRSVEHAVPSLGYQGCQMPKATMPSSQRTLRRSDRAGALRSPQLRALQTAWIRTAIP